MQEDKEQNQGRPGGAGRGGGPRPYNNSRGGSRGGSSRGNYNNTGQRNFRQQNAEGAGGETRENIFGQKSQNDAGGNDDQNGQQRQDRGFQRNNNHNNNRDRSRDQDPKSGFQRNRNLDNNQQEKREKKPIDPKAVPHFNCYSTKYTCECEKNCQDEIETKLKFKLISIGHKQLQIDTIGVKILFDQFIYTPGKSNIVMWDLQLKKTVNINNLQGTDVKNQESANLFLQQQNNTYLQVFSCKQNQLNNIKCSQLQLQVDQQQQPSGFNLSGNSVLENIHNNKITGMELIQVQNQPYLMTSSRDGTIKSTNLGNQQQDQQLENLIVNQILKTQIGSVVEMTQVKQNQQQQNPQFLISLIDSQSVPFLVHYTVPNNTLYYIPIYRNENQVVQITNVQQMDQNVFIFIVESKKSDGYSQKELGISLLAKDPNNQTNQDINNSKWGIIKIDNYQFIGANCPTVLKVIPSFQQNKDLVIIGTKFCEVVLAFHDKTNPKELKHLMTMKQHIENLEVKKLDNKQKPYIQDIDISFKEEKGMKVIIIAALDSRNFVSTWKIQLKSDQK